MSSADSPGPSTSNDKPVYIFDLDETVLSVNSFPRFVKYLLLGKFEGLTFLERNDIMLHTASVLIERKFLKHDHLVCKRDFQKFWDKAIRKDPHQNALHRFVKDLLKTVRPNMQMVLEQLQRKNEDCILATAAAAEYAQELGAKLGFRHVISSPDYRGEKTAENVREKKRDNVLTFLKAQGWQERPRIFFTDHHEDLPLIRESQYVFWLGEDSLLKAVQADAPQVNSVAARNKSGEEILALIAQEN